MGTRRSSLLGFVFAGAIVTAVLGVSPVIADPIYVFQDKGVIRFTNKAPPPGIQAKVFTAKGTTFSFYRGTPSFRSGRLFLKEFEEVIGRAARIHALDQSLIRAVIHVESAFNPRAVSPKGAQGLMQLMPEVAVTLGVARPFEPEANILAGSRLLAFLLRKYDGNLRLALAAYNAGEGAVEQYGGVPPFPETQQYVRRVLELRARYGTRLALQRGGVQGNDRNTKS